MFLKKNVIQTGFRTWHKVRFKPFNTTKFQKQKRSHVYTHVYRNKNEQKLMKKYWLAYDTLWNKNALLACGFLKAEVLAKAVILSLQCWTLIETSIEIVDF